MVVRIRMTESFILCRSYRTLSLRYLQCERAGYGAGQGQQEKNRQREEKRVRRRLNRSKNGHAAKHWAGKRTKAELRQNDEKKRNADD